ncbi:MAG: rhodanese-like domain-containing protein [Candidatus Nanopelagicales bacterium]
MGLFDRFKVPSVSASDAREWVRSGAQLVDVRETGEWNAGHAPQAVHIPTSQVSQRINRLKKDKDIVVVCRSGNRSRSVTSMLRKQGYEAFNLSGGMRAWESAGGQVADRRGRPGRIA